METNILIVLGMVIVLIVVINGLLVVMFRNAKDIQHIQLIQRAVRQARNPWQKEEEALQALSQLVSQYKEDHDSTEETAD